MDTHLADYRSYSSIPQIFFELAQRHPERAVYSQAHIVAPSDLKASRSWQTESYRAVSHKVARLATYLSSLDLGAAPRIAIISYTRPEWMIADLAILTIGGTSVSIYQSINAAETGYILHDSASCIAFAENIEQLNKLLLLTEKPTSIPAVEDRPATMVQIKLRKIIAFEPVPPHPLVVQLSDIFADAALDDQPPSLIPTAPIASLVYTSGTTGPPKGVIQTHENHIANLWQASTTKLFAADGSLFLFLPLAHSFARLVGYIGFLTPTILKFPAVADPKSSVLNAPSVLQDLAQGSAECVPMVPRILEKMRAGILSAAAKPGIAGLLVRTTLRAAEGMYAAAEREERPALSHRLLYALTTPLRSKIKEKLFGPHFQHVVSGGAKLPVDVNTFFRALGVTIYEGYGLTETCVATNVNRLQCNKIGSVGPCLPEIIIKILEDGEICFQGPNVTKGYLNRPQATTDAWDGEGWFHTGDLGSLDSDGYLYITGRKKELIVTSGGKKISPQSIEDQLISHYLISSAVVVGDGKPYCVALIIPDRTTVQSWVQSKELTLPNDFAHYDLAECDPLRQEISAHVESVNQQLSKFETIKRFRIIDTELTVDNGMLTPTFKVRRSVITAKFASIIEELYRGSDTLSV